MTAPTTIKAKPTSRAHSPRRGRIAAIAMSCGLVGLAWRAWAVQVTSSDHYRALAERQHEAQVDIPAARGEIRDRRGRPLAVSADAESIWANPQEIRDVAATAETLARSLTVDAAGLEAKLAADRRFVWLARHVKPEVAAAVRAAKLPGVEVAREPRRWYPNGALASTVIGRADIDGNGVDGVELALNRLLTGTRGSGRAVRDVRGRRMFADGLDLPEPGATVTLTLDLGIQAIAEAALVAAVEQNAATSGTVVVLEVGTGDVLAMASAPGYEPNNPATSDRPAPRNRTVADAFEAGSVMKLFSVAAAVDAGAVTPTTMFDVQWGKLRVGRDLVRDVHNDRYLSVSEIIKRSSNVGAVKIAQLLGRERLAAALKRFGFAARTEIELPGEQRGTMRPGSTWRDIELATISFGYGLTVSPLQLAAAIAAIGDDGRYRAPRIVHQVAGSDGSPVQAERPEPRQAVSLQTAQAMRAMLATVFEGGKLPGTAASLVVPGFRCGGKTGTAHKYDPELKGYSPNHYLSSFIGLAPIDHPRLAIAVLIDDPRGGDYYGGKVAGPVFARVASEALRYLAVPGDPVKCAVNPASAPSPPVAPDAAKTCVK